MHAEFLLLLFIHAHREAQEYVKHILGMNYVATQPNLSSEVGPSGYDYC